jgi:hypothetical protein
MKLIQDKKNVGNVQDQLALEILFLEENTKPWKEKIDSLNGTLAWSHRRILVKKSFQIGHIPGNILTEIAAFPTEAQTQAEISSYQLTLDKIQIQIEAQNRTYEKAYGDNTRA